METLKKDALIKGIDFTTSFYERLSSLFVSLATLYGDDPETWQPHIETLSILMATIDDAAREQGLTEELDLEDLSAENASS